MKTYEMKRVGNGQKVIVNSNEELKINEFIKRAGNIYQVTSILEKASKHQSIGQQFCSQFKIQSLQEKYFQKC